MFDPPFFAPLIELICKRKSVCRKVGLLFVALHTRACARACAAHMGMTRSPNIKFNKKIEILMWHNSGRVRNGASFAAGMGVTHV